MILQQIKSQFQCDWWGHHGVRHWARVRHNGLLIGKRRHLCSEGLRVVELFSVFHDACRVNEYDDPDHGPRGAMLAKKMRDQLNINDWQMKHLVKACEIHTHVKRDRTLHNVVQVCLDADRSDIARVGMYVDEDYIHNYASLKDINPNKALMERFYQRRRNHD